MQLGEFVLPYDDEVILAAAKDYDAYCFVEWLKHRGRDSSMTAPYLQLSCDGNIQHSMRRHHKDGTITESVFIVKQYTRIIPKEEQ